MKSWVIKLLLLITISVSVVGWVNAFQRSQELKGLLSERSKELDRFKEEQQTQLELKNGEIRTMTQKLAQKESEKDLLNTELAKAVKRADNIARVNADLRLQLADNIDRTAITNVTAINDTTYNIELDYHGIKFDVVFTLPEAIANSELVEFPPIEIQIVMTEEADKRWLASAMVLDPEFINVGAIDIKINPQRESWLNRFQPGWWAMGTEDGFYTGPVVKLMGVDLGIDIKARAGFVSKRFGN